jgi:hypothetical protein
MAQPKLHVLGSMPPTGTPAAGMPAARITRPTLAKAKVCGRYAAQSIRVENGLLKGWVSWVMSIHSHCYGCEF